MLEVLFGLRLELYFQRMFLFFLSNKNLRSSSWIGFSGVPGFFNLARVFPSKKLFCIFQSTCLRVLLFMLLVIITWYDKWISFCAWIHVIKIELGRVWLVEISSHLSLYVAIVFSLSNKLITCWPARLSSLQFLIFFCRKIFCLVLFSYSNSSTRVKDFPLNKSSFFFFFNFLVIVD